jgi:hypothetical protein
MRQQQMERWYKAIPNRKRSFREVVACLNTASHLPYQLSNRPSRAAA